MSKIDVVSESLGELKADIRGIHKRFDRIDYKIENVNKKLDSQNGVIRNCLIDIEKHKMEHAVEQKNNKKKLALFIGLATIGATLCIELVKWKIL